MKRRPRAPHATRKKKPLTFKTLMGDMPEGRYIDIPYLPRATRKRKRVVERGRLARLTGHPRNAFYELRVFYNGGLDEHVDYLLFKAVGSQSVSSGCFLQRDMRRDHEWEFVKLSSAQWAAGRILNAIRDRFQKHGIKTKVRVEIWDTKPKRVFVDGAPQ